MWMFGVMISAAVFFMSIPAGAQTVYSFGVVPQFEPRKLAAIWKPILKELEERSGLKFKMVGSPDIASFEATVMEERFDFAYMNPYHAMRAAEKLGYEPLVRDGQRFLYGILVVQNGSPIKDVRELNGRDIAFPAPNALAASLLMRTDLTSLHGIQINPVYVQTHSSVYLHVAKGLTVAGGGVMSTLKRQGPEIRSNLRILYKTRSMQPHPVTAHPRVPKEHRELVRRTFLELAKSAEGAALLAKVPMRKPVVASANDYLMLKGWGLERFYIYPKAMVR